MKRKSPFAKAIAKQLATPAGRAEALASIAQVDPAAARRIEEKRRPIVRGLSLRRCGCGAEIAGDATKCVACMSTRELLARRKAQGRRS